MTLSRRDLEEGRMRAIYMATVDAHRALSDEALAASLAATLAKKPAGSGWWVFAYGSLLWNPLFPFADAKPALLSGLHRHFCLWSLGSRGTSKVPGLVLGLDRGGSCRGVAYRLPARCARAELALLWRREMVVGSYKPRWLQVKLQPAAVESADADGSIALGNRKLRILVAEDNPADIILLREVSKFDTAKPQMRRSLW